MIASDRITVYTQGKNPARAAPLWVGAISFNFTQKFTFNPYVHGVFNSSQQIGFQLK